MSLVAGFEIQPLPVVHMLLVKLSSTLFSVSFALPVHLILVLDGMGWCIGRSKRGCHWYMPPQWDPILSFSHMFVPKSAHAGGRCPPMGNPGSTTVVGGACLDLALLLTNG